MYLQYIKIINAGVRIQSVKKKRTIFIINDVRITY